MTPDYEIIKNLSYQIKKGLNYGFIKNPFKDSVIRLIFFQSIQNLMVHKCPRRSHVLWHTLYSPKNVGLVNEFLLDGKYGSIYMPDNKKDFQEKIVKIINNYNLYIKKVKVWIQTYINTMQIILWEK